MSRALYILIAFKTKYNAVMNKSTIKGDFKIIYLF